MVLGLGRGLAFGNGEEDEGAASREKRETRPYR